MALPIVITPGDLGHIVAHETIHGVINDALVDPFDMALDGAGLLADRPSAGRAGRYYLATDESILYRDSGTGWVSISNYLADLTINLLDASSNVAGFKVPVARLGKSVSQNVADSTEVTITFDRETGTNYGDTDDMHSIVSATGRITFKRAGWSIVGGQIGWSSSGVGGRRARIRKTSVNGDTVIITQETPATSGADYTAVTTLVKHAIGDYVELLGYQTSGTTLTAGTSSSFFAAYQSA